MIHITLPDPAYRYGIRNRPSTPMKNVIGNYYGIEAELIALEKYHEEIEFVHIILIKERNRIKNLMKGNKSTQLNAERTKKKIQELRQDPKKDLFKLSRFTNKATSKVKDTIARNKADLKSRLMDSGKFENQTKSEAQQFEQNEENH